MQLQQIIARAFQVEENQVSTIKTEEQLIIRLGKMPLQYTFVFKPSVPNDIVCQCVGGALNEEPYALVLQPMSINLTALNLVRGICAKEYGLEETVAATTQEEK